MLWLFNRRLEKPVIPRKKIFRDPDLFKKK
jgi:hypothetical protein